MAYRATFLYLFILLILPTRVIQAPPPPGAALIPVKLIIFLDISIEF